MTTITTDAGASGDATWRLTWLSGPDAGQTAVLGDGRWIVGRARQADVRCDDPALEPFHVELSLWPHGEVVVQQLAGRTPVRRTGAVLEIGTSSLSVVRSERVPAPTVAAGDTLPPVGHGAVADHRDAVVVRPPRAPVVWEQAPLVVPAPPRRDDHRPTGSATVLVTAAIAVVGAVVMAVVVSQPVFALFGALGALAAVATVVVDRVARRRSLRRERRRHAAALDAFTADAAAQRDRWAVHHRAVTATLATAVQSVHGPELWARRPSHGDAFTVSLGVGRMAWRPTVADAAVQHALDEASVGVDGLPVPLDLGPGARVAAVGVHAEALVRSLLLQLATTTGPADWQLVIASDDPARWAWLTGLPHAAAAGSVTAVWDDGALLDAARRPEAWADRHTVLVTDRIHQLALRTGALRRAIAAAGPDVAVVAVDTTAGAVPPALCSTVVVTAVDGTARVTGDVADAPQRLRTTGVGAAAAAAHVALLAGRRDPEDPRHAELALPSAVALTGLTGGNVPTPDALVEAWRAAGHDAAPATAIGVADDGVVDVDLVRDGPHALIAGTTGSGKSELLRSLVIGLSAAAGPDLITFVLVDYKGGAAFDCCADLPHVVGVVTDLDDGLADRVLRSLRAELTARERLLRTHGAADLEAARSKLGAPVVPRLVVMVDEFAALAAEHPHVLTALVGIAQRGRSLGVHLVLATQRPSGVISDDIRANTNLRLALRLHDAADATDVVADPAPATFRRSQPGRAALRLGPGELVVFQAARCTDAEAWVGAITTAASAAGLHDVRRPWCEPLPAVLASCPEDGSMGSIDVPDEQARRPLRWIAADGHLLVVGAAGTGVTSTLVTAVGSALRAGALDVLVVDPSNDERWSAVSAHPACAGVVRLHERERLLRLLRRATSDEPSMPAALVVIDGLAALRAELEPIERDHERAPLLERLLTDPPPRVTVLLGADRATALPSSVTALCPNRWLHHVHDRHDAGALGAATAASVPPAVAGRVVIVAGSAPGCAAQVVTPGRWPDTPHRAERITVLGPRLGPSTTGSIHAERALVADIGTTFDALAPALLEVPDGDHVLVVGPGRSGRSQALAALAAAWVQARPTAEVVAVAPRRSPWSHRAVRLDEALDRVERRCRDGSPTMLVVDDADMVDDPGGRLAALVERRSPLVLVAAAGRPDSLRHAYGHWTGSVRRSRIGIAMAACSDLDGDLLGITIPRRMPLSARPGLAWVTLAGGCELVQLRLVDESPCAPRRERVLAPVLAR